MLESATIKINFFVSRIFDEGDDGHIFAADLVEVLTNLGDRLTKSEARKLVQNADVTGDGRIDYTGSFYKSFFVCNVLNLIRDWS